MVRMSIGQKLPKDVYVMGIVRDSAIYGTPIRTQQSGFGLAPLTVLDADGERALPVFTTLRKAERGIRHFMANEDRTRDPVAMALCGLDDLLATMTHAPEGLPRPDYIGIDMGEGGIYPLIRL